MNDDLHLTNAIAAAAGPLSGAHDDYDRLIAGIGDAAFVLIGEASHGTHEFYRERAQITKRLIAEKGFNAVAVEADWPDAFAVHRFVLGRGEDGDTIDALSAFRRFPQWMWRNADVLDFAGWLRAYNDRFGVTRGAVGFYGLDLYSLHASTQAVLAYLDRVDADAAARARQRYSCFEDLAADPQAYGYAAQLDLSRSCEDEVVAQLIELQRRRQQLAMPDGAAAEDEQFAAEQNALVVQNAERYYRGMFGGRVNTWNLRDTHMADTLDALARHLARDGAAKIVVWAHNSHLGDARATEVADRGELNLGQLARERHAAAVVNVGFTTYSGTVSAASEWDAPVERKRVRPALAGSYEALFHAVGVPRFVLNLRELGEATAALGEPRLERAIGVIYKPETERWSHYFECLMPAQFDFVLHIDETRAVEPLERSAAWQAGELPETYPEGL
jgi:erythromycin esterase-like protein